jgi:hypothetical protein
MKTFLPPFVLLLLTVSSCKEKPKEEDKKYVSIPSLIEKQVSHVDTSLYSIQKIIITDSVHTDTTYIRREEFRDAAKDFFAIPDMSSPGVANRFKEESSYDTLIRRVILTYTPVDPKKEEFQKQQLLISQDVMEDGSNKVTSIIIDRVRNNRDGYFAQNMLWQTDKNFLVTTTTQKPGEPEKITTTKVVWNGD